MDYHIYIATSLSEAQIQELQSHLEAAIARGEHLYVPQEELPTFYKEVNNQMLESQAVMAIAQAPDGHLAGSIFATWPKSHKGKYATLNKLLVIPADRGHDLGRKLFFAIEADLKQRGIEKTEFICWRLNPAVKMYNEIGYRPDKPHDAASKNLLAHHDLLFVTKSLKNG